MAQSFAILLKSSPFSSSAVWTALEFSTELLLQQHTLALVFLTEDAVLLANPHLKEEPNAQRAWQSLQKQYNFDILVCSASAARRGILESHLAPSFLSGSFGQWFSTLANVDKVLTFG